MAPLEPGSSAKVVSNNIDRQVNAGVSRDTAVDNALRSAGIVDKQPQIPVRIFKTAPDVCPPPRRK